MPAPVVIRPLEARAVGDFLTSATSEPSALVIDGEAGIGKSTLWSAACEQARERGFLVLSTRGAEAESVLAYAALVDLLAEIDTAALADLPEPQRLAVDRILLRTRSDGTATDQRAIASGFLSVVETLSHDAPVLLAIDDLQWLDVSSLHVVAFAARRLTGPIGVLGTLRTDATCRTSASWLQLPRPDAMHRLQVRPLSLGGLHAVVCEQVGRSFSRPAMVRIQDISGGNPFYAIELARAMDGATTDGRVTDAALPGTLAGLVQARIGRLDGDAGDVLLAAACLSAPTVALLSRATPNDAEQVLQLLEDAESKGVVEINGQQLGFSHPLLARGVYTQATPERRRAMHRRLADIVEQPELAARHLALAATGTDSKTCESLDLAAESARLRGAPAAAAELIDLALDLGGDTPARRIRLAGYHLGAGDTGRARAVLQQTIGTLAPGPLRAEASSLIGFVHLFDDSFTDAAGVLERALNESGDDLALRTRLLTTLSYARYNAGRFGAAARSITDAVTHAERLGQPHPLSQALSMRVVLRFLRDEGLDNASLARAVELEDRDADVPMAFRPTMQKAMLLGWTGQLDKARHELASIRRRCVERGEENELIFVAVHSVLLEIWRGDFVDAAAIAEDTMERARQLGGDVSLFVALTMRATLAAFAGREQQARSDIGEALAASQRCGANLLVVWPITTLGFLEVSLGNHDAALSTLAPLLAALEAAPDGTEIVFASFVPDAVEALIQLGRLADSEPLVDTLERNGRRLDRAWMLAVGGRCRAMLLAARGDVDEAIAAARQAMADHERLPMPFERARTQLLLGQLQSRQRHEDAAASTLRGALDVFDELGTPLWTDRARAELTRSDAPATLGTGLTPPEQRIAELAASGMTNRDVAAALFISPKTVEANLFRIYRKIGIRSRAELGRRIGQSDRRADGPG